MSEQTPYIAIIPAYEPDERLVSLVQSLQEHKFIIYVIDDGSGPAYTIFFDQCKPYATVLSQNPNQGKGAALKSAYAAIKSDLNKGIVSASSVCVTLDCDGQHTLEDTIRVCQCAVSIPDTLVLGSRQLDKDIPKRSQFGNSITRKIYQLFTRIKVYDTQTGLRAFHINKLDFMLSIEGSRYEYEMNVLIAYAQKKMPIKEIPIHTLYFDNNKGSHFRALQDSFLVYGKFLKFICSSLIGFLVDYGAFSLLVIMTTGLKALSIPVSNVAARIISASVNFAINRKFVFKSDKSLVKSALSYFMLAACILAGNTVLITILVNTLHVNKYVSKLITEILFFTLSYLVQHFIIFKKQPKPKDKNKISA